MRQFKSQLLITFVTLWIKKTDTCINKNLVSCVLVLILTFPIFYRGPNKAKTSDARI